MTIHQNWLSKTLKIIVMGIAVGSIAILYYGQSGNTDLLITVEFFGLLYFFTLGKTPRFNSKVWNYL